MTRHFGIHYPVCHSREGGNPAAPRLRREENLAGEIIWLPVGTRIHDPSPTPRLPLEGRPTNSRFSEFSGGGHGAATDTTPDPTEFRFFWGAYLSALLTGFALGLLTAWAMH